jgi:hypothetical protein
LVLLTAREHFICHWLLVKRYNQKTNERKKMLFAFHKMCFSDPSKTGKRINNSKTFEKYRKEFKQTISNITSKLKGNLNSQYNKKWYTNRDIGECKSFSEPPNEKWVAGRNLFKGECSILVEIKKKLQYEQSAKIYRTYGIYFIVKNLIL